MSIFSNTIPHTYDGNGNTGGHVAPPPAEVSGFSILQIGAGEVTMSLTDPSDSVLDHIAISVDPADTDTETVSAGT